MAYDKSKEKILTSTKIPDDESNPQAKGTLLSVVQYDNFKPQVRIERFSTDQNGVEKVLPFVTMPSLACANVSATIKLMSEKIESKFGQQ